MYLATRFVERCIAENKVIPTGTFNLDRPIVVDRANVRIVGSGFETILRPENSFPAIVINQHRDTVLADFRVIGGLHGVLVQGGSHIRGRDVKIEYTRSHGVFIQGGSWCNYWTGCQFKACHGSGYHSVRTPSEANGHNTSFAHCQFWLNKSDGLTFAASTLDVTGCLFEANGRHGVALTAHEGSCAGVSIRGTHFEACAQSQIWLAASRGAAIVGVSITGNLLSAKTGVEPLIKSEGPNGTVRFMDIPLCNEMFSPNAEYLIDLREACRYCKIVATTSTRYAIHPDPTNRIEFLGA